MIEAFDFLLNSGPLVVFAVSADWRTALYTSRNVHEVLGYSEDLFRDDPLFWKALLHPEDAQRVNDHIGRLSPECPRVKFDNRIRRGDGQYIHVRSEIVLRLKDETPACVVGFFVDRTHDVEQAEELEHQRQQLEAANMSLEQFVYIASHDLREPLIGIAGYATLTLKRHSDKLDDSGKHFLEEAVRLCKNLEQKIDDLLELSRAGRGKPHASFALGSALEQAKRSLVGSIERTGAVISYDQLPTVRGDRSQVAQVFQNLFSNAIKYQTKGVCPTIEIRAEEYSEDPGWWLVSVADNGIGFDMKHAERVFGVFQRLYTIEQYPGTGIGLAIVKKIVDKHGGAIWPSSQPGGGTTFYFTLPKTDDDDQGIRHPPR